MDLSVHKVFIMSSTFNSYWFCSTSTLYSHTGFLNSFLYMFFAIIFTLESLLNKTEADLQHQILYSVKSVVFMVQYFTVRLLEHVPVRNTVSCGKLISLNSKNMIIYLFEKRLCKLFGELPTSGILPNLAFMQR